MNSLDPFFQSDIVHALGWTIIHSFWQGLLVVILLTIALVMLSKHSSRIRYLVGYLALLSLALCSVGTFIWHLSTGTQAASVSQLTGPLDEAVIGVATAPSSPLSTPMLNEDHYWQSFVHFLEGNLPWFTILWMIGVLLLTLRFLAELAYVQRLKHQPGGLSMASYQDLVSQLAASMGIRQFIELKENIRIHTPMVIGFVKPVILIPLGLLSNLDPSQVESILAHELAHIRRHDYFFNLLQSLVEIVLFFNPATWWISSLIRTEREHSCDEMAITETGNPLVFVQTLAKLEEYRSLPNNMALGFNGHRDAGVLGRVKRILNSEEQFRIPYKLFWSSMILLCSLGLLAFQDAPVDLTDPAVTMEESNNTEEIEEAVLASDMENLTEKIQSSVKEKEAVLPSEKNREQEKHTPTTITKEDSNLNPIALTEGLSFNGSDTVPPRIKQLKKEMMELAKTIQEQEMVFQQQNREIQQEMLTLQKEVQQMENEQLKELYELEKNDQEIQLKQNIKLKEMEIEHQTLENEIFEKQYSIQSMNQKKLEAEHSQATKEEMEKIEKERGVLIEELNDLKKKKRDFPITQQRKNLEIEKQLQLLHNKKWKIKEESKISQNEKQLKIMEIEQRLQEAQFKSQMRQSELQNKMKLLEMQIQEEMQKWKERQEH